MINSIIKTLFFFTVSFCDYLKRSQLKIISASKSKNNILIPDPDFKFGLLRVFGSFERFILYKKKSFKGHFLVKMVKIMFNLLPSSSTFTSCM